MCQSVGVVITTAKVILSSLYLLRRTGFLPVLPEKESKRIQKPRTRVGIRNLVHASKLGTLNMC